ncbi:molybdenum cofactor guanylyltransferase MobA [Sulfurisoma sediminicola]|uniref:molybdenum cofactor guanylyltransferase MobA n=1 Tax=Sulfurisoma sediminicola TaxID=1381557 RepID=UPI001FB21EEA|nr:molybdenum cofactor guanylyltransferase MobA [Sulfurisoma sediminicola]
MGEAGLNAPPSRAEISGLVLAGGQALRMGGIAKGLAPLQGRPLLAHVIERLAPQVARLAINANRPEYGAFGLPLVADVVGGFAGPLAGLHAGLLACTTPWLVTAPCDAPLLPHDLVARLAQSASPPGGLPSGRRQRRLFVATSPRGPEPGFMLAHVELAPALGEWLQNGGRKARDWLAAAGACEVAFADGTAFANINTPDELARLQTTVATQSPAA